MACKTFFMFVAFFTESSPYCLFGSEIEEEHSEQDEEKIHELCLEVLLVEDGCSEEEADDDRTTANHAHDTDHGTRQTERIEIYEVGSRKEDADEDDAPVPMEWGVCKSS